MDWIQNLLFNDASVAHTVILYAFVIALGVALGKIGRASCRERV